MDDTGEPCARQCGDCMNFKVLDDSPVDPSEWFGVCARQVDGEFWAWTRVGTLLDFAYTYGRHGEDDCENPDEWFEE